MGELEGINVVTEKVDVDVRPCNLHEHDATDTHHVGPFDDDQTCRNVPQFVFPWAGEQEHEEEPVQPLFQTGTFGSDGDNGQTAVFVDGGNNSLWGEGGNVNAENMVEHPTGLAIDQIDRPKHKFLNPISNRPIVYGLPTQIEIVEADYQHDKKPHIDCATIFRVFIIGLNAL